MLVDVDGACKSPAVPGALVSRQTSAAPDRAQQLLPAREGRPTRGAVVGGVLERFRVYVIATETVSFWEAGSRWLRRGRRNRVLGQPGAESPHPEPVGHRLSVGTAGRAHASGILRAEADQIRACLGLDTSPGKPGSPNQRSPSRWSYPAISVVTTAPSLWSGKGTSLPSQKGCRWELGGSTPARSGRRAGWAPDVGVPPLLPVWVSFIGSSTYPDITSVIDLPVIFSSTFARMT